MTHRWAYSNTSELWFCEVCHRHDRSGHDVPDDERCPAPNDSSETSPQPVIGVPDEQ